MYNYLLDHAINNVWCNPNQDNQLIFEAKRISKPIGELNNFKLMNSNIDLPISNKRFQIYQVGQIHPNVVGLLPDSPDWTTDKWIKFSDAINAKKLFVSIYSCRGVEIPKFTSYYMYTDNRALIFAIEHNSNLGINYKEDVLYFRLYSNAYFNTERSDVLVDRIHCEGIKALNLQQILDFQNLYNQFCSLKGSVIAYKNGLIVDSIDIVNIAVGDTAEFIYDSSIKEIVTLTIKDLAVFKSILDDCYKYLLIKSSESQTIDFIDDIDIHVIYKNANGRYKGLYYHHNASDSYRMITHDSYSIKVDYFTYFANELNNLISSDALDHRDFKVQIKIREAGYLRPLVFDNYRIFELYKLPYDKRVAAMTDTNSVVPEWRAENLEASGYTELMNCNYRAINTRLFQRAYGYNAMSVIVGQTPSKTYLASGRQTVDLKYNLQYNSTIYEYDADGVLLGYYYHREGSNYECMHIETRLVEAISGKGSHNPEVYFGIDNISLPIYDNYRVYMCHLVNGIPDNRWEDITDSEYYTVANNKLVWSNKDFNQFLMVRTDRDFLAYSIELSQTGGIFYFTLSELEDRGDGLNHYTLPVPLGEIDLFLNGRSLIHNLDYVIEYPRVILLNKAYLKQPANTEKQVVTVRFTGFCNKDFTIDKIDDFGFIEHGLLSNNNRYDLRDDKVLRITYDGRAVTRDDVIFSELHDGISVVNALNGKPYQIKDIIVPLKELVNENTYSLRAKSIEIDKRVSDYMTIKLPEPTREYPSAIANRYPLISTFIARIIDCLKIGMIDETLFINPLSDNDIINICRPYEYLLSSDPCCLPEQFDVRYILIHPHTSEDTIDLSLYQYRFLLRVVKLYCNDRLELTPFITFST